MSEQEQVEFIFNYLNKWTCGEEQFEILNNYLYERYQWKELHVFDERIHGKKLVRDCE